MEKRGVFVEGLETFVSHTPPRGTLLPVWLGGLVRGLGLGALGTQAGDLRGERGEVVLGEDVLLAHQEAGLGLALLEDGVDLVAGLVDRADEDRAGGRVLGVGGCLVGGLLGLDRVVAFLLEFGDLLGVVEGVLPELLELLGDAVGVVEVVLVGIGHGELEGLLLALGERVAVQDDPESVTHLVEVVAVVVRLAVASVDRTRRVAGSDCLRCSDDDGREASRVLQDGTDDLERGAVDLVPLQQRGEGPHVVDERFVLGVVLDGLELDALVGQEVERGRLGLGVGGSGHDVSFSRLCGWEKVGAKLHRHFKIKNI